MLTHDEVRAVMTRGPEEAVVTRRDRLLLAAWLALAFLVPFVALLARAVLA